MDDANPYEAPSAPLAGEYAASELDHGLTRPPQPDAPITVAELRTVVGPRADRYLAKWPTFLDPLTNVGIPALGFHAAAFLFAGFWLAYRKMYKASLVLYGVVIAETVLEWLIARASPGAASGLSAMGRLLGLALAIVCGIYGRGLYLNHVGKVVTRCRAEAAAENLGPDAYAARLARRGGTNALAGLGLFLAFIVVAGLVTVLFDPSLLGGE
jgi:Protein of unknown function (DUF2628)